MRSIDFLSLTTLNIHMFSNFKVQVLPVNNRQIAHKIFVCRSKAQISNEITENLKKLKFKRNIKRSVD